MWSGFLEMITYNILLVNVHIVVLVDLDMEGSSVSTGAWPPSQECATEAQQKTGVWQRLEMTLHLMHLTL